MTPERVMVLKELLQELHDESLDRVAMPNEVFDASLKIFPQVAIETVIFRWAGPLEEGVKNLEVHLYRRPEDDQNFPALLHSPGSFLRARESPQSAAERVMKKELGSTARLVHMEFVDYQNVWHPTRGYQVCLVFACLIEGEPSIGEWHPVLCLPADLVAHHYSLIIMATPPLLRHWCAAETVKRS